MRFVVVGGGVAGVCCAEELCRLRPQDEVTLVSASRVLKGVSVVARLSRNLEELALVERRLDELPYPNLRLVQDIAAGIDTEGKALLLGGGVRLPYDKLCLCAGARPKQLPPSVFRTCSKGAAGAAGTADGPASQQQLGAQQAPQQGPQQPQSDAELEALQQRVLTIRDTDSVARLAARLKHSRRVVVVGNGGIALELISGLKGADVTWVMKHAHIGDAYFDLDAAQFLLEELQHQRRVAAAAAAAAGGGAAGQQQQGAAGELQHAEQQQQEEQQGGGIVIVDGQQTRQQEGGQQPPAQPDQQSATATTAGSSGVLGHAVGPRWVQQLPPGAAAVSGSGGGGLGSVDLEYGAEIAAVQFAPSCSSQMQQQQQGQQQQQQQQQGAARSDSVPGAASSNGVWADRPLLLTLTNGRQLEADLVLLVIGVRPALEWVPAALERAADGGLRVNRCMQSSDPAIYAAGDSASCQWAADESRHWFQMRLWSQARAMGVHAAHCMAGVQEQTGSDMAFELFTHVTRFLGKKVVLLGLYNGQRLQGEPAQDVVTYSRVDEEPEGRSFVRVLLLRGRVQGAVLIGQTDLDETLENLIMDQLDVGSYGPHLLDPDVELDHVFD